MSDREPTKPVLTIVIQVNTETDQTYIATVPPYQIPVSDLCKILRGVHDRLLEKEKIGTQEKPND